MAVVINLSDPGAVPGASTNSRDQNSVISDRIYKLFWWLDTDWSFPDTGAKQDRRGRKGRAFARHGSAVIGPLS